ncbi:MAG: DUF343 domain [Lasallia pustulata]|uniref:Multifunctional methyltransferase subunit trm112 n=1 Tax=Lasallia pustulata TaxID=136370 RepID=A0A5M8Q4I5_9LECA|nr:MAG: DUF343 domain [Lasallia pustulata]
MPQEMKLLTANFLTCAVKACQTSPLSFPLHFRDAELEHQALAYNPTFLANILPRIDWEAFKSTAAELGFSTVPGAKPEGAELGDEGVMRGLQRVLMETRVVEGKMVCGNCGHEYRIKEGIANFLLPNHLV